MKIEDLYREVILDHYKNPQNKGLIKDERYHEVHLFNASCGDDVIVQVYVNNKRVEDVRYEGKGCSICCSSASVMTTQIKNQTLENAFIIIEEYFKLVKGEAFNDKILNGEPLAYQGVTKFPARVRCATIAWKACETALKEAENEKQ
jgi:nitrogen fixation NifU-like protein